MGLTLVTAPSEYPVTLAQAKEQCRVIGTRSDSFLNELIADATHQAEKCLGRSIMEQTWKLTLDCFSDAISLPRGPVRSVSSVQYYDTDGALQTLDSDYYTVDLTSDPQWVVRNSNYSWPSLLDAVNVVSITYVAGFTTIPRSVTRAILLAINTWFDDRDAGLPKAFRDLLLDDRDWPQ